MAVTPYIILLWQTKTGKVLIYLFCLFLLGVFVSVLIDKYGWWVLLFAIFLALCGYLDYLTEKRGKEKEMKKLREESDRLHELYMEEVLKKHLENNQVRESNKGTKKT